MESISSTIGFLPGSFTGSRDDIVGRIMLIWAQLKAPFVVPFLRILMYVCLVMSIMLFTEKVYMAMVTLFIKLTGRKTEKRYKWEPFKDDVELGHSVYPLVLVQVPMFNEKEVYQLSIGAACGLSWPSDRIVIQVLDDSTDPLVKGLVEMECQRWAAKGVNIHYQVRDNRNGYKAGALKEGLKHRYANECEYVAIFDADFQPEPDFLWHTIPYLHHNSELGLVQARWKFVNSDECLMTRMQEMSLDYHFKVEQESGSSGYAFFGFNGTAGVWRMAALNEAGGWKDRTTVEDMDLAVKNELPSNFKALRYQQHRWSCGPANLFRKMVFEILTNKKVPLRKRIYVIYSFFFVRKIVAHIVTFVFYCVVIPASVMNVMSLHRTKATFIGLFEAGRVNEWVVTEKHGDASKAKAATKQLLMLEISVGCFLVVCACYDLAFGKYRYYIYLYIQAIAFFIMGFGYVGAQVPNS
ncbi:hypothetical protein Ccrd_013671 [Cynara cardunculus var. scolymus]|uniref:glucomannan 4-beta-mannosyltransferase n=1 Tax=Cynara cardunculus var. scolymus TaxID=59895 RepID=A0A118K4S1_CYNCS|nr:hypothetical protein Ccrd_013671 [Cynara cardunculus var. scolymus]